MKRARGARKCRSLMVRRQHNIKVCHISDVHGQRKRVNDGWIASNFFVQAPTGPDIKLCSDDSQVRLFCCADESIGGLDQLRENSVEVAGRIDRGNPGDFAIRNRARDRDSPEQLPLEDRVCLSRCSEQLDPIVPMLPTPSRSLAGGRLLNSMAASSPLPVSLGYPASAGT
jgi:hypothetical protein